MGILFIKKFNGEYTFAMNTSEPFNLHHSNDYNVEFSKLQVISNKKHLVFFTNLASIETTFLKIALEKVLSTKEEITFDFLNQELVPIVIKTLEKCYRLQIIDKDNNAREIRMRGNIVIVSSKKLFVINRSFRPYQIDNYINDYDHNFIAIDEILNFQCADDFMNQFLSYCKKSGVDINYPITSGNETSDVVYIKKEDSTIELNKEDFICHL